MKLQVPFLQLPVKFDAAILAEEIERLSESAWQPHPQGFAGNSAIPLVSREGNPTSNAVAGPMRPTPQLEACPYLMQVMATIGGVWGRSRLMRLSGQAEVTAHVDIDYYWREHIRVHVPIVTQPEVRFDCGSSSVHMAAGECWVFDTWSRHRVINSADRARIHLVADTVGGSGFWNLVGAARVPERTPPGWQAQRVDPQPDQRVILTYESTNVPVVMTPWEVKEHLAFLLDEATPHPALATVQQLIGHFSRHWRSLWATHGESASGFPDYRDALKRLHAELQRVAGGVALVNGTSLLDAVKSLVIDVAVNDGNRPLMADERSGRAMT